MSTLPSTVSKKQWRHGNLSSTRLAQLPSALVRSRFFRSWAPNPRRLFEYGLRSLTCRSDFHSLLPGGHLAHFQRPAVPPRQCVNDGIGRMIVARHWSGEAGEWRVVGESTRYVPSLVDDFVIQLPSSALSRTSCIACAPTLEGPVIHQVALQSGFGLVPWSTSILTG